MIATTHVMAVAPAGGLPTWAAPRADAARFEPVPQGHAVVVLEREGDWARVQCANGWTAWTDARLLTPTPASPPPPPPPPAPPPAPPSFVPSHVVAPGGVPAWATPDASNAPETTLGEGTEVRVLESRGTWAHVECANGWSAWVDARLLVAAVHRRHARRKRRARSE